MTDLSRFFVEDYRPKVHRRDRLAQIFDTDARSRVLFARLPLEEQYFLLHAVSVEPRSVVLLKNSKAGCTSLAAALYEAVAGKHYEGSIHTERETLIQGPDRWRELKSIVDRSETFRFSAVRDPKARLVSAFLDFFVEKKNPGVWRIQPMIEALDLESRSLEDQFSAFLDALEVWLGMNETTLDRHWRPQYRNLAIDYIQYDFLGRLEELKSWYCPLSARLNALGVPLSDEPRLRNASQAMFAPNRLQTRRIEALYAKDFEIYETLAETEL